MLDVLLLVAAAFGAGMLNAAAGGGSFLTLPALVGVGMPAAVANATGTLALLPGYLTGAWALRRDIAQSEPGSLAVLSGIALAGGGAGALLLLWTSGGAFRFVAPWLLLFATALFLCAPAMLRMARGRVLSPGAASAGLFVVSLYGGYFNGGMGIMLLALFGMSKRSDFSAINGLKNLLSGVLTVVAAAVYVAGGLVEWREAGVMAIGATAGGFLGARLARRVPVAAMRAVVVLVGILMSAFMFLKI
ncbi:hypothetical protein PIGHUM_00162 [Pigmentiphaga humi]|uniref:Probable membrane transporter protein n=1 Tax=Pigmentiphaga humi TaxID=2478468 RepID=A0A3P4AWL5_9BURK|nr:sulfite exporter TauE/SafE family protein [Pigmentiphaga humi]VCU68112.1 hypothetical protein PIGHUM_00162 [Pigmentiphaga humi]